jgi:hypothetical protein
MAVTVWSCLGALVVIDNAIAQIDGEEYPAFLFEPRKAGDPLVFKPEFDGLFDPQFITDIMIAVLIKTRGRGIHHAHRAV